MRDNLKKMARFLIFGIILYFIGATTVKNWSALEEFKWNINYHFLTISILLSFFSLMLFVMGWIFICHRLGIEIKYKKGIRIWFFSQITRYVPGNIWAVLSRIYLCGQEGINKSTASLTTIIEWVFQVLGAILVFLIFLPFMSQAQWSNSFYPLLMGIPFGLVLIHPSFFGRMLNFVLLKLKKEQIEINTNYIDMVKLLFFYITIWFLQGLAFYFLVKSVAGSSIIFIPDMVAIFAAGWTIGFLSFLTPMGLGVREGVIIFGLSFYTPLPVASILAILSRILWTFSELAGFSIVWVVGFKERTSANIYQIKT